MPHITCAARAVTGAARCALQQRTQPPQPMLNPAAEVTIARELALAEQARQAGNEGRARVCARRAAGWAVAAGAGIAALPNAFVQLQRLAKDSAQPAHIRSAAAHLTLRITSEHLLPGNADPLSEARSIIRHFLPQVPA
ncbi:MAG: hypothetical protein DWI63_01875 [Chloroflexi bacterium]|nr:MAG: hypothetical protein DWI63_01875 [Chloroflexota bacterium]